MFDLNDRPTAHALTRFFGRVRPDESGCWEWTGAVNGKGYGVFCGEMAHRVTYSWFVGQIPSGLHIDHLCFNRWCVNAAHMEAVTVAENTRRGNIWNRTGRCFAGHRLTPDNIYYYRNGARGIQRTCRRCRIRSRNSWVARRTGRQLPLRWTA